MQSDPPEPKFRRRAEQRPDEVLDAALALFTERGYAASSVDAIAGKAGISKGSVYLYFPSKQAILEALVLRAIEPVSAEVIRQAAQHGGNIRQTATRLLTVFATRLSDPAVLAVPKIVIRETVVAPEIAEMYRRAVLDRVIPAMATLIREGIERGELRPVDPDLTVRSVIGPLVAHLFLSEVFGIHPADGLAVDRLVENHLSILFDGLAAGRKEHG